MKTFGQLKQEMILQVFPSGAPENLLIRNPEFPAILSPLEQAFQEGAAQIAKWVECEQDENVNLVHFCKTFFKCGMTVIPAPKGIVRRLFTVANRNYCDPVVYRQVDWPEPECWARNMMLNPIPLTSETSRLPLGFIESSASHDSAGGRARTGMWALHNGNIYIAPWIQSNEFVVIEWSGIKAEWSDDDVVNDAQDYRLALRFYFQYAYERDYGSAQKAILIHDPRPGIKGGTFDEALGDLIHECREQRKTRDTPGCGNVRARFLSELVDDVVPEAAGSTVVAQIGNFGVADVNAQLVAQLVMDFGATAIVSTGNNVLSCPARPINVVAEGLDSKITVTWDPVETASGYVVSRSLSVDGTYETLATIESTVYVDLSVVNGTPYYYKVSARNAACDSGQASESATATAQNLGDPCSGIDPGEDAIARDTYLPPGCTTDCGPGISQFTPLIVGQSSAGLADVFWEECLGVTAVHGQHFNYLSRIYVLSSAGSYPPSACSATGGEFFRATRLC